MIFIIQSSSSGKLLISSQFCFVLLATPHTKFRQMVNEKTPLGDKVDPTLASKQARQRPNQKHHGGIKSEEKKEVKTIEKVTEDKDGESPLIAMSMLHPVISVKSTLPMDKCCDYPTASSAHHEGSIDSHIVKDYLEPEMEGAREIAVPTGRLRMSKVRQEQISSIVLNLKVCLELLQQGNASLDVVERYLQNRKGKDKVDFREDAPTIPSKYWIAVGPPSLQYHLPPHPLAKEPKSQLNNGEKLQTQVREREELAFGIAPFPFVKNDCQEFKAIESPFVQTNRNSSLVSLVNIHPRTT